MIHLGCLMWTERSYLREAIYEELQLPILEIMRFTKIQIDNSAGTQDRKDHKYREELTGCSKLSMKWVEARRPEGCEKEDDCKAASDSEIGASER